MTAAKKRKAFWRGVAALVSERSGWKAVLRKWGCDGVTLYVRREGVVRVAYHGWSGDDVYVYYRDENGHVNDHLQVPVDPAAGPDAAANLVLLWVYKLLADVSGEEAG